MLSYKATRDGMRILELESRCAVYPYRGFESHPFRSAPLQVKGFTAFLKMPP